MSTPLTIHRGSLLLVELGDALRAHRTDEALHSYEIRPLIESAAADGAVLLENKPQRLLLFHPQHQPLLSMARGVLALCARIRNADAQRHALAARLLLGYGPVQLQGNRALGDWTHRMNGSMAHVPAHSIAALSDFVETCPPEALTEPAKSLRPGLFLLQTTDTSVVETQLSSRLSGAGQGIFTSLTLRLRGEARTIQAVDCPILLGRDQNCTIQLSSPTASRVHGRIDYQQGRFFYVDDSRNGSYILTNEGEELRVNHDRLVLVGSGAISPGAPISEQKGEVLRFVAHSQKLGMQGDSEDHDQAGDTRPMRRS